MMKHLLRDAAASARRQAPWWLLGATGVAVVPVLVAGELAISFWRWTLIAAALVAGLLSRFANKNPTAYGLVVLAGVVHLTVSDPFGSFSSTVSVSLPTAASDVAVSLALAGLLASVTNRRVGMPKLRDVVEVMVVFIGASISTWVLLTQPLLDDGVRAFDAVVISVLLPLNVLIATFLIDLWTDGLQSNRAMQLASTAAVLMAGGSVVLRLDLVTAAPTDDPILQGLPVPAPSGARANDPDGLSPNEDPIVFE